MHVKSTQPSTHVLQHSMYMRALKFSSNRYLFQDLIWTEEKTFVVDCTIRVSLLHEERKHARSKSKIRHSKLWKTLDWQWFIMFIFTLPNFCFSSNVSQSSKPKLYLFRSKSISFLFCVVFCWHPTSYIHTFHYLSINIRSIHYSGSNFQFIGANVHPHKRKSIQLYK